MQSHLLSVLAVLVTSADCLALRVPACHATRCHTINMAAKRGKQGVTRREALSGGGFNSDDAYKNIANAGMRLRMPATVSVDIVAAN